MNNQADPTKPAEDSVTIKLSSLCENILIFATGFLPLLFIPLVYAPLAYTKVLAVVLAVVSVTIILSISFLRKGQFKIDIHRGLLIMAALPVVYLLGAIFSGDISDSLVGYNLNSQTALFVLILWLLTALVGLVLNTKDSIMRLLLVLTGSTTVLGLFHLFRTLYGPDTLSFGVFNTSASSPLGNWNDVGVLFTLATLIALIVLIQLPLTRGGLIIFSSVIVLSLFVSSLINFTPAWVVLLVVSLVLMAYEFSKGNQVQKTLPLTQSQNQKRNQKVSFGILVFVLIISGAFSIYGKQLNQGIAEYVNISYLEVKPSLNNTLTIAGNTLSESLLTGAGPNRFGDSWNLYKQPAVNETLFWNTTFTSGYSYFGTALVEVGILGAIAWTYFIGYLCYLVVITLSRPQLFDRFWYFLATVAGVAAVFLWLINLFYVSGVVILILASVFTGLTFVTNQKLSHKNSRVKEIEVNSNLGLPFVGGGVITVLVSLGLLYFVTNHYGAFYKYSKALALSNDVELEQRIDLLNQANQQNNQSLYERELANYKLARLQQIVDQPNLTDTEKSLVSDLGPQIRNHIEKAISLDTTDPVNWRTRGRVFSFFSTLLADEQGTAYTIAKESFAKAKEFDPLSPVTYLLEAELEFRQGNLSQASEFNARAISLNPRYIDAFFLQSQIDISNGDVKGAISSAEAAKFFDPTNPSRHYQLGVLYAADNQTEAAIVAFSQAVELSEDFANAKYFLALAYQDIGENERALELLLEIREQNPNNSSLIDLIEDLQSGEATESEVRLQEAVIDSTRETNTPRDFLPVSDETIDEDQ